LLESSVVGFIRPVTGNLIIPMRAELFKSKIRSAPYKLQIALTTMTKLLGVMGAIK